MGLFRAMPRGNFKSPRCFWVPREERKPGILIGRNVLARPISPSTSRKAARTEASVLPFWDPWTILALSNSDDRVMLNSETKRKKL